MLGSVALVLVVIGAVVFVVLWMMNIKALQDNTAELRKQSK
jgi:hypothetical protein